MALTEGEPRRLFIPPGTGEVCRDCAYYIEGSDATDKPCTAYQSWLNKKGLEEPVLLRVLVGDTDHLIEGCIRFKIRSSRNEDIICRIPPPRSFRRPY